MSECETVSVPLATADCKTAKLQILLESCGVSASLVKAGSWRGVGRTVGLVVSLAGGNHGAMTTKYMRLSSKYRLLLRHVKYFYKVWEDCSVQNYENNESDELTDKESEGGKAVS